MDRFEMRTIELEEEYFKLKHERFGIGEAEKLPDELREHPLRIELMGLAHYK